MTVPAAVGVYGGGRMGAGIAHAFAAAVAAVTVVESADEALAARLLNEVVPADDLEAAGHRLADRIGRQAGLAVRLTKSAFHAPRDAHPLIDDLAQAVLFETEEKHDRMTAFLQRRKEKP